MYQVQRGIIGTDLTIARRRAGDVRSATTLLHDSVDTGRHECRWRDYTIIMDGRGRQHRWCELAVRVPGDYPLTLVATTTYTAADGVVPSGPPERKITP